ncbi:MAG: PSD1 domain-containing protein [Pirellulaceae bacterium]|nr:PSD1 domain-containing protein [Pirellulaceae bacterium]
MAVHSAAADSGSGGPPTSPPTTEQIKFFETKIRPVLIRECYSCHSNQVGQVRAGLWLDTAQGLLTGGVSGPAIVPGNVDESLLWNAINHIDYAMPPKRKLPEKVLADFRVWIEMGAPDPRAEEELQVRSAINEDDIEQGRQFWSFQKPVQLTPPQVESDWFKSDIDRWILDKLTSHQLQPSPDAEPLVVLRRLCFDIVGLPPTPEQVKRFQRDWQSDPDRAVAQTADWLLEQPQFGERWGRHWLDVARYAESSGREVNVTFPHAWRYRDYVIDAFNADKPYHEFVIEQIAGDLLPVKNDHEWASNLIATGFLTLGAKELIERNPRQFELDLVDEQIDVTTRVMLGVSVACARCHDHKFEPIPQSDYYALAGIFRSMSTHFGTFRTQQNRNATSLVELPVDASSIVSRSISKQQRHKLQAELAEKQQQLQEALRARRLGSNPSKTNGNQPPPALAVAGLSAAIGMLQAHLDSYDENGNPRSLCMAVQETKPVTARLLERGEFNRPAQEVPRGFPRVLCVEPVSIADSSTGRLELARWIGSRDNPLTARVMVNRVWLHLFGNGLVRTPEDFGSTGAAPTHPELLDCLAVQFMDHNWSVKRLVRDMVTSRTYRMSSRFDSQNFQIDPDNHYLWRMPPRRLEAEAIRDAMLAISGQLDTTRPVGSIVGRSGPSVIRDGTLVSTTVRGAVSQSETNAGQSVGDRLRQQVKSRVINSELLQAVVQDIQQPNRHRSVYLPIIRDQIPRALEVLDFAESTMVIGQRDTSHTPAQGLYFLNNSFVIEQAQGLARRLMNESSDMQAQLKQAFLLVYGRPATGRELRVAGEFYRSFRPAESSIVNVGKSRGNGLRSNRRRPEEPQSYQADNIQFEKLTAVCQSLMATAEFRFLD